MTDAQTIKGHISCQKLQTRTSAWLISSNVFGRTSMLCSSTLGNLLGWHEQLGSTVSEKQLGTTPRSHEALRGDSTQGHSVCGISRSLAAMPFLAQSLLRNTPYGSSGASCSVADSPPIQFAKPRSSASLGCRDHSSGLKCFQMSLLLAYNLVRLKHCFKLAHLRS